MTIRFKEGYKKNLQRRAKETNFKKQIKNEYFYYVKINYPYQICTFRGYYIDKRGTIKQANKYSKRYRFKTPKYYRHMRRRYFNRNVENFNITNLGRNYTKIISKNS